MVACCWEAVKSQVASVARKSRRERRGEVPLGEGRRWCDHAIRGKLQRPGNLLGLGFLFQEWHLALHPGKP